MPPSLTTCPEHDDWRRFLLGEFWGSQAESYEEHLTNCSTCATRLREEDRDDEFVAAMRRGSRILSEIESTGSWRQDTRATLAADPLERHAPEYLDPPDRAGEIGRLAGYRVLRQIGRGGNGIVYLAEDERLGRRLALKVILDARRRDGDDLARFEREAQLLAQLQHPGIVRIFEAGAHRGRPYLALEYVGGGSLARRLQGRPLSPTETARIGRDLAQAVQHAHEQGVIHRDLKPGNVLVSGPAGACESAENAETPPDDDGVETSSLAGRLKIADFGLARRLDDDGLTKTGDVFGTPGYMAPEQLDGRPHGSSPAVDVYGLGAILYELLTGRPPFRGGTALETMEQARTTEPVAPRTLRPGLPRDLETICLKCLEKEPSRRYADAKSLAAELDCFLEGRPIRARPPGLAGRLAKWARRRPGVAALASLLTLSLLASVLGGAWYERSLRVALRAARDANEVAEEKRKEAELQTRRADANYEQARDTVQKMLLRTKDARWNSVPRLQQLRREQAETALAFFRDIAAQESDRREARVDAAWAAAEAGKLQVFLGQTDEGLASLRRAADEADALSSQKPDDLRCALIAADARVGLGAYSKGPAAVETIERGVRQLEAIRLRHPDDPAVRSSLIDGSITLGAAYVLGERFDDAERSLLLAIRLVDEFLAESTDDPPRLATRARARVNLAAAYRQAKRTKETREQHALAETDLARLIELDPLDRATIEGLAVLRINGAFDLATDGRPADAVAYVRRNVPILEAALRREPDDVMYRDRLYRTYGVAAMMLKESGKHREAAETWEHVVAWSIPDDKPLRCVERIEYWLDADDFAHAQNAVPAAEEAAQGAQDREIWGRLAAALDRLSAQAAKATNLGPDERAPLAERYQKDAATARTRAEASAAK